MVSLCKGQRCLHHRDVTRVLGCLHPSPIVPGGLRWGLETGEIAHLLPRCLSLAFARPASTPWALLDHRTRTQPPY